MLRIRLLHSVKQYCPHVTSNVVYIFSLAQRAAPLSNDDRTRYTKDGLLSCSYSARVDGQETQQPHLHWSDASRRRITQQQQIAITRNV